MLEVLVFIYVTTRFLLNFRFLLFEGFFKCGIEEEAILLLKKSNTGNNSNNNHLKEHQFHLNALLYETHYP